MSVSDLPHHSDVEQIECTIYNYSASNARSAMGKWASWLFRAPSTMPTFSKNQKMRKGATSSRRYWCQHLCTEPSFCRAGVVEAAAPRSTVVVHILFPIKMNTVTENSRNLMRYESYKTLHTEIICSSIESVTGPNEYGKQHY